MSAPLMATYAPPPLVFDRGEGCTLYTAEGEAYLDAIAGIAVNALGHAHPTLVETLKTQAEKLWHLSNMFEIPAQKRLAQKYCETSFAERVFFTNSGTEAIECALKTARRFHAANGAPERIEIIGFEGAFHGRSYAAINAAANPKYLEGFGPALPGYRQLPFGDHDALREAVTERTCAVVVEPVQGEGGVRPLPPECLQGLRALCDATGTLLIYDEVQCGAGRTGKLWAHQWANNAEPDIMAVAKGVGGGFPLGACLATEAACRTMVVGAHGSTYGGNPLATAVGDAVFDLLTAEGFMDEVVAVADHLAAGLADLADRRGNLVAESRGKGLLRGLKLRDGLDPKAVQARAREHRLLVGSAGDNVVRLAPPLVLSQTEADQIIDRLDAALSDVAERRDGL